MSEIRLLYGATIPGQPLLSSDLLWKTQFKAPDPFFFCEFGDGRNIILAHALEYERAKKEAINCSVELLNKFMEKANSLYQTDGLIEFLKANSPNNKIVVHGDTPCSIVKKLQDSGLQVEIHDGKKLWYPERASKNTQEVQYITEVQRKLEKVTSAAIQILREATVSSRGSLMTKDGVIVTSEYIRGFMDVEFMREGCFAIDTIVACGEQGADPHCVGTGPLQTNLPIIFDVFPRSKETFYWADMTRTIFKGKPTEEAKKMYQVVLDAQRLAIDMIHVGVDGSTIQSAVTEFFEKNGYHTGEKDGKIQGFMHGVGHSLGIDIHESPGIRKISQTLPEGCVVTVEPGLYYFDIGGVRIEDLVVVEKDGVRNLTVFPKEFEEVVL